MQLLTVAQSYWPSSRVTTPAARIEHLPAAGGIETYYNPFILIRPNEAERALSLNTLGELRIIHASMITGWLSFLISSICPIRAIQILAGDWTPDLQVR